MEGVVKGIDIVETRGFFISDVAIKEAVLKSIASNAKEIRDVVVISAG